MKAWKDTFQDLKENNFQPRLLYPTEITFIIEREAKILHDNKNKRISWPLNQHSRKEFYTQKRNKNTIS
jgi:hypothetical protein